MDTIKEKYYTILLKYEKHISTIRDKLIETAIKAPIWAAIQFVFWKAGSLFFDDVHFFTSVYDVLSRILPGEVALIAQAASYYILLNPAIELLIILALEK